MFCQLCEYVHFEVLASHLLLLGPATRLFRLLQLHFDSVVFGDSYKPLFAELGGCLFLSVLPLFLHLLEFLSYIFITSWVRVDLLLFLSISEIEINKYRDGQTLSTIRERGL